MAFVDSADLAATSAGKGAAMVGFRQTGATTDRTVQLKLQESISVKDFGATGNGSTDDTLAFKSAIAHCLQARTALYIPSGTYRITDTLLIQQTVGITIHGDGYASCLRFDAGGTYICIHVQGTGFAPLMGMCLRDFRVDANGAGQLDTGIVTFNNVVRGSITGMWLENGTRTSGSSGQDGISCSIGAAGGTGPQVEICGNFIRNTSKAAINWTSGSARAIITHNIISEISGNGTAPGIQLNGGFDAIVTHNQITGTQGPGIYVATDGSGNPSRNAIIAHNVIDACGASSATQGDGILMTSVGRSVGRVILEGNQAFDCGTNANGGSGICVIDYANVVISGNLCRNNRFDGIRIENCDYVNISGNRCTGNNLAGVSYAGGIQLTQTCSDVNITSNHLSDDKSVKTQSYGIILNSSAVLSNLNIEANKLDGNAVGPLLANTVGKPMLLRMVGERQTTDGSASNVTYFQLPDDIALRITAKALGKKSDSSARAIYAREGLFYRDGGSASQQGATTTLGTDIESNSSWVGLGFATSSNLVVPQVTGVAGSVIDWRVELTVQTI